MDTFITCFPRSSWSTWYSYGTHFTLLRGHSDTGKTTALLEAAVSAQKMGILPIFIITEMKWNWEHAAQMGLDVKLVKDDTGEVLDYEGNFIYVDRETFILLKM
jgi:hypothetical protein